MAGTIVVLIKYWFHVVWEIIANTAMVAGTIVVLM